MYITKIIITKNIDTSEKYHGAALPALDVHRGTEIEVVVLLSEAGDESRSSHFRCALGDQGGSAF